MDKHYGKIRAQRQSACGPRHSRAGGCGLCGLCGRGGQGARMVRWVTVLVLGANALLFAALRLTG